MDRAIFELFSWYEIAGDLSHQGEKGSAREDIIAAFIKKFLPMDFDVGRGFIEDANGTISTQTDIIIYDKHQTPRVGFGDEAGKFGIYPFESVYYVIEVKSTSTLNDIRKTNDNFKILRNLKSNDPDNQHRIITAYFAFASDTSNTNELEKYLTACDESKINPPINILCCLKQGYWYFNPILENGIVTHRYWNFCKSDSNGIELASLLSGILRTLNRKDVLSFYVLPNNSFPCSYYWQSSPFEYEYIGKEMELHNRLRIAVESDEIELSLKIVKELHPQKDKLELTLRSIAGFYRSGGNSLLCDYFVNEANRVRDNFD